MYCRAPMDHKKKDEYRFFADAMLGKLARWMRTLGYDVNYEKDIEDSELVKKANEQDRVILTRDTLLVRRREARGRYFFVEGDSIKDQLRQVVKTFRIDKGLALTRCIRCNLPLAASEKDSIRERVPPYVYYTQEGFSACPGCKRVYWAGTHKEKMLRLLSMLLEDKAD